VAFTWDDDKAASNFRWHGVRFGYATRVFQDPNQLAWLDDREDYGEARFNVVGLVGDLELFVTYTKRGEDALNSTRCLRNGQRTHCSTRSGIEEKIAARSHMPWPQVGLT
jgi:uncharacterized DUF497 family protein